MRALRAMLTAELKIASRNFIYMFFSFAFPPLLLLLFGSMYGNQPSEFFGGYGAVDILVPSYIPMILAVSGLMGLPLQLAMYRHNKVLKRFRATPITTGAIMWPHFIVNALLSAAGIILLLAVGKGVFGLHFFGSVLDLIAALAMSMSAVFSLGFMIAAAAPNDRVATLVAYLVYFPMLFISGSSLPREMLPEAVKIVANILPLTHSVTLLQGIWLGGSLGDFGLELVVLAGYSLVFGLVALKTFRWE